MIVNYLKEFIPTTEAARQISRSQPNTVRELLEAGIELHRFGERALMIRRSDWEAYVSQRQPKPQRPRQRRVA